MSLYEDLLALAPNRKQTPNGWISFNAPCCVHRGENRDTKKRGGIKMIDTGGVTYNCFNCGYKASWKPGRALHHKMKTLLVWMGASTDQINKITFECLKTKDSEQPEPVISMPNFVPRDLPKGSLKITEELIVNDNRVHPIVQYIDSRGLNIYDNDFYWSSEPGFIDRMIIPITVNHELVGYIARKITDGKPKFITEHPAQIVFNLDKQKWERKFVLVFEGSVDAMLMEGVAILTNKISPEQALQINNLGKQVIVVPDQDKPGLSLIERALDLNWSVSFPNWTPDIKDAGDAVKRYGRLATFISIIKNVESNPLKIKLRMKL